MACKRSPVRSRLAPLVNALQIGGFWVLGRLRRRFGRSRERRDLAPGCESARREAHAILVPRHMVYGTSNVLDGADSAPLPIELMAVTVNVYACARSRPSIVIGLAVP
jgi:hypothetical protein